ncbi:UNVERIFIED_CONTAM: hypothetical protein GTU68_001254 [Idotea baltica]|nr:hypothetical protein [Idotea baltica]
MTLKLYNFPQSTCSQKVRLVLWEKGLEFIDRPVDSTKREHLSDWYLKLNPHGVVPTLIHNEDVIIDSSVIIEYLDEVFPNKSLTPSDPVERAKMRKWMRYFEEVPTPAVRVPSFNQYLSKRFDKMTDEQFKAFTDNHPIRRQFYKKMTKEAGFDSKETDAAMDRMRQTIDFMEQGIEKSGGPWLMGEFLSLADYCILPVIDRMHDLGHSMLWSESPKVSAWYEGLQERDAYKKTYYQRTRLTEIYDGVDLGGNPNPATIAND